ncbi:MAG: Putative virion core protein (lumpy skin disease virus) [uncultured Thiotrichaceae bacterium]|uniref:Virion core protein (Lumpy skin disease virus) n=1 Tax=uncultured Thiotrichaceae bacterium TaxID=298394 RepID=A0A6S6U8A8_9GAMM|nr:MAG: Putative virion core protein (lumpy skin disease virus) [uncultured Thiotrichaceae bacterium]
MGFFDKLFGEFVDVIEWTDDSNDTMIYRFERYGNEIKYGAKLTVRESQAAVFVNEGEVADVIEPGMYELETKNLPILSTLQHWDHGLESPFKAEVYFCNMTQFVDLKWGTKNPIMLRDEEFGGVRLRAFGTYATRIKDPVKFIKEIVGTDGHFTIDEISDQLRNLIISRFTNVTGNAGIPILDMAANYDQLGEYITQKIAPEFEEYGLELTKVLIENISLPSSVEEALDKRTSMGMIGNLDEYLKYQAADALGSGAGGTGDSALDMGMGFAVANKMADSLTSPAKGGAATTTPPPPPLPPGDKWHVAINEQITGPYDSNQLRELITENKLTEESLVWKEGMADWAAAGTVEVVKKLIPPSL